MWHAMIAVETDGKMQPIGTLRADDAGFTYSTQDGELMGLLQRIKRDGIMQMRPAGARVSTRGKTIADGAERERITQNTNNLLIRELNKNGYQVWTA